MRTWYLKGRNSNKRYKITTLVMLLLLSLASGFTISCSHVHITMYREPYPPTTGRGPLDNLRTYTTKRPEKEYHEIAQIICDSDDYQMNLDLLQFTGKKIGADAIIIVGRVDSPTVIGIAIKYGYKPANKEYMEWTAE